MHKDGNKEQCPMKEGADSKAKEEAPATK